MMPHPFTILTMPVGLYPVMAGRSANLRPTCSTISVSERFPVAEVSAKLANLYPGLEIDTECTAMLRLPMEATTINASVGNRLIEPGVCSAGFLAVQHLCS